MAYWYYEELAAAGHDVKAQTVKVQGFVQNDPGSRVGYILRSLHFQIMTTLYVRKSSELGLEL